MPASVRSVAPSAPRATYRLQLGRTLPFAAAAGLTDYLAALGVSHCYASPILRARSSSAHGYDGVDPTQLDPKLGGDAGFAVWDAALREAGLGLLLDIVPNHLCVVGGENPWWQDVLTHGRGSPRAICFDIDWDPPDPALAGRVLLPLLGQPLPEVLAAGELRVVCADGALAVAYHEHRWPLAPHSWSRVLTPLTWRRGVPAPERAELSALLAGLRRFRPPAAVTRPLSPRVLGLWQAAQMRLARLLAEHPALLSALGAELDALAAEAADYPARGRWARLLEGQAWRLAYWQEAGQRLNYRRFFDITELAGLRQEDPRVFAATHARVLELVAAGSVQGLRIDHPDGLAHPAGYLRRLRRALHAALARVPDGHGERRRLQGPAGGYVVVEKILDPGERRRGDWPVEGGTGYDMLYRLNAVQVDTTHAAAFRAAYARCTGDAEPFAEHVHAGKRLVLRTALAGDVARLARRLQALAAGTEAWREVGPDTWRNALEALATCMPVYRTYVADGGPASTEDSHWLAVALAEVRRRRGELDPTLVDWLGALLAHPAEALPRAARAAQAWVTRFQQLTGAAMAKGLEDTAYYRYVPLVSLNEVGGDPATFGINREAFHAWNRSRARRWPHALSATATHDTKRGEDVRARLNALSEVPEQWEAAFHDWQRLNARHRTPVGDLTVPDPITEYLLYQTLVGAWPLGGRADVEWAGFAERIAAYLLKAVREAKRHTSWTEPNAAYEEALARFVAHLLAPARDNPFPEQVEAFLAPLQRAGLHNSLAQTLLKLALPGVPDFYQGTELWDFSLVDPDNRRPVDFQRRRELLEALPDPPTPAAAASLLATGPDGRIKLHVIRQGLALRTRRQALFSGSDYRPLAVRGERERHAIAFARTRGRTALVAAVGRFFLGLPGGAAAPFALPVGKAVWGDTVLEGARGLPGGTWRDVLTGQELTPQREAHRLIFPLARVFAHLPVALLERIA
ncbi:MAG TPA: malto-oligosyltrehalose synthase [bacterium]|nr:malto-oligosyltrehalose synthase [bacterium]